jgi:hypothetical protein
VNGEAEPIQDNGPLSGPEIFVTGPAFSELGAGNVRLPTAHYLLLPFSFESVPPRGTGSAGKFFQTRLNL